jgi:hypothetical protein
MGGVWRGGKKTDDFQGFIGIYGRISLQLPHYQGAGF